MPNKESASTYRPLGSVLLPLGAAVLATVFGCSEPQCQRNEVKVGMRCVEIEKGDATSDDDNSNGVEGERTKDAAADASTPSTGDAKVANADDDAAAVDASTPASNVTDATAPSCVVEVETCDGKDNDCDGIIDNGVTNACGGCASIDPSHAPDKPCDNGVKEGLCAKAGVWQCNGGTTVCSAPDPTPSTEICDSKDNDCDGVPDNGIKKNSCGGCATLAHDKGAECDNGLLGECYEKGTYACSPDSESLSCSAKPKTGTAEVCDEVDNDCNGHIDDEASDAIRWYRDCDGDGFAASKDGSILSCKKPPPSGTCKAWTDREPLGITSIDCDPESAAYRPGADYGVPLGGNSSNDLNCDGRVDTLTTLTTTDGSLELPLCAYATSCDCYLPVTRNGALLKDWSMWTDEKTNLTFHPSIACSRDQSDTIRVGRLTSGANKIVPTAACAGQLASNNQLEAWETLQRCR